MGYLPIKRGVVSGSGPYPGYIRGYAAIAHVADQALRRLNGTKET